MNTDTDNLKPKRRRGPLWPWICGALLGVAVAGGLAAVSILRLDADAATLRAVFAKATPEARWERQVEVSVGEGVLAWARLILRCTPAEADAHTALAAVRAASVSVWRSTERELVRVGTDLIGAADAAMHERGWSRIVGVREGDDTVLVYVPNGTGEDEVEVCVAVCDGEQLIVTSARTRLEPLLELVERHTGQCDWLL